MFSEECFSCVPQGIFVVGGMQDSIPYPGNHTEIIDPFSKKPVCKNIKKIPDLPSEKGRYGMVGAYLGNKNTMFCGGVDIKTSTVIKDCIG